MGLQLDQEFVGRRTSSKHKLRVGDVENFAQVENNQVVRPSSHWRESGAEQTRT